MAGPPKPADGSRSGINLLADMQNLIISAAATLIARPYVNGYKVAGPQRRTKGA
jgi:hypothetical protein